MQQIAMRPLDMPAYTTPHGSMYCGDSLSLMRLLPPESVDLVVTSPPFPLVFKKTYGNVDSGAYTEWFMPFAAAIHRLLAPAGSFVVELGSVWNKGQPTKSLYQYQTVIELTRTLFHLAQDFFWYNPSKLPSPAEWVTVRRVRVKDSVSFIWWLSKSPNAAADNRRVLVQYSESMKRRFRTGEYMQDRPSGWRITEKFNVEHDGAIPSNMLSIPTSASADPYLAKLRSLGIKSHPARFPVQIPEFFIKFLTKPGDMVLDPFAGSNTTGFVADQLDRSWISVERDESYVSASRYRFDSWKE